MRKLRFCYSNLSECCTEMREFAEAKQWLFLLQAHLQEMIPSGSLVDVAELGNCYGSLGEICREERDFSAAMQWYQKQLKLCEDLVRRGMRHGIRFLSTCYYSIAATCLLGRDLDGVKKWAERWVSVIEERAQSLQLDDLRELADVYERRSSLCYLSDEESSTWLLKCKDIWQTIAPKGTKKDWIKLAMSYSNLCECYLWEDNLAAQHWLKKSKTIQESLENAELNADERWEYQMLKDMNDSLESELAEAEEES